MDVFAWPSVALLLGLAFMFVFRQPISAFLSRIREVNRTGIKAAAEQPSDSPLAKAAAVEQALRSLDSPILQERERAIVNDLADKKLGDGPESNRVLIRHLAILQLAYGYEIIENYIYGSQLELLRHLNSMPQGQRTENLRNFYDSAATEFPEVYKTYSFESWLGFLQNMGLVTIEEDRCAVTSIGRDFLAYLVATGRTGYKPL